MRFFWHAGEDEEKVFERLQSKPPLSPFHPAVLEFAGQLSKKLLRMRHKPELAALGYWLRKAHIYSLKTEWEKETENTVVKARGTVFHLAPSNVDTIFVYSWLLALFAGNRNIIRLSAKEDADSNELLAAVIELLKEEQHEAIAKRTVILTYAHEAGATEEISRQVHTRVIWGGDETVHAIRAVPLAPLANEVVFPNRFSLAVFHAESVVALDEEVRVRLLNDFYNDVYWFEQMACSSPRLIVWTGSSETIERAQAMFWEQFHKIVEEKRKYFISALQVQKLSSALSAAVDEETKSVHHEAAFTRVQMSSLKEGEREKHCGGGLFYECSMQSLKEVAEMIEDKDQTVSYFGFAKEEMIDFAECIVSRGADRIVPVGQALHFDEAWDGQRFLRSFTREVVIV